MPTTEVETQWATYAASYDRVLCRFAYYRQVVARHLRLLCRHDVKRGLDRGAATGIVTARLLRRGRHVTAVDTSPAMLARLRSKISAHRFAGRCTIRMDDAQSMPELSDGAFDAVNILLLLYAVPDP